MNAVADRTATSSRAATATSHRSSTTATGRRAAAAWCDDFFDQARNHLANLIGLDDCIEVKLVPTYGLAHQNRAWLLSTVKDESLRNPVEAVKSGEAACKLSNYQSLGEFWARSGVLILQRLEIARR